MFSSAPKFKIIYTLILLLSFFLSVEIVSAVSASDRNKNTPLSAFLSANFDDFLNREGETGAYYIFLDDGSMKTFVGQEGIMEVSYPEEMYPFLIHNCQHVTKIEEFHVHSYGANLAQAGISNSFSNIEKYKKHLPSGYPSPTDYLSSYDYNSDYKIGEDFFKNCNNPHWIFHSSYLLDTQGVYSYLVENGSLFEKYLAYDHFRKEKKPYYWLSNVTIDPNSSLINKIDQIISETVESNKIEDDASTTDMLYARCKITAIIANRFLSLGGAKIKRYSGSDQVPIDNASLQAKLRRCEDILKK